MGPVARTQRGAQGLIFYYVAAFSYSMNCTFHHVDVVHRIVELMQGPVCIYIACVDKLPCDRCHIL